MDSPGETPAAPTDEYLNLFMILLVPEHAAGTLRPSAREIAAAARTLQSTLGGKVHALLLGPGAAQAAAEMAPFADQVHHCEDAGYAPFIASVWAAAVAQAAQKVEAKAVILPATRSGLSYGPRVAVRSAPASWKTSPKSAGPTAP